MSWFKRFFGRKSKTDQLIDAAVECLRKGKLDQAAALLDESDNCYLRTQATSIRQQIAVLQQATRFPNLGALMGPPDALLADYLETEIPYLETFKSRFI